MLAHNTNIKMAKKLIETPEIMWALFNGYKKEVEDNPFKQKDWVGKDATEVKREYIRCLIMEGFECYVMDHTEITYPELSAYFSDKNDAYGDFYSICSRIRREIRKDQLDKGFSNLINPSITQRMNNLKETTVLEAAEQPLFPKVDKPKEIEQVKLN